MILVTSPQSKLSKRRYGWKHYYRIGLFFIQVLDLAKAYDTVLKELLLEKLSRCIPPVLVNQPKVFVTIVIARVTGNITNTEIPMGRGLRQGGTHPLHC